MFNFMFDTTQSISEHDMCGQHLDLCGISRPDPESRDTSDRSPESSDVSKQCLELCVMSGPGLESQEMSGRELESCASSRQDQESQDISGHELESCESSGQNIETHGRETERQNTTISLHLSAYSSGYITLNDSK